MATEAAQNQDPAETPQIPRNTFAARLVLLRHELGLTVDEVSTQCGVASATWSTWEHGTKPRDMAETCTKISDATGYSRDWLAFGTPIILDMSTFTSVVTNGQMELPLGSFSRTLELVKVGE